ncbi:MAG: hypothetical protein LIQ30_06525, partial [Planctomycetes bacterium]|nr:hypothetical protein [Planctomycetota bacterium]
MKIKTTANQSTRHHASFLVMIADWLRIPPRYRRPVAIAVVIVIIAGYIIGWQFESSSQAHPAETTTITNTITNDSTNKNDSPNTNTNVTNITITLP